ncbi:hypothetical protein [Gimesia aquarii]|uniref:Uncharacterized protein n=1 Tax=Gimesia aquarii TaxID=2527964 RepID=A0A517WSL0_9PLAN|nr:hypothetical protein [Gimesia aquarii]QDU08233.1 hypothetical protein V202x_15980 [Gimesia aquarii]
MILLATRSAPSTLFIILLITAVVLPLSTIGAQNKTKTEEISKTSAQKKRNVGRSSAASMAVAAETTQNATLSKKEASHTFLDAPASDVLKELIREVQKNEQLYSDLKLTMTSVYEKLPKHVDVNKQNQSESEISIDLQGQKFCKHAKVKSHFWGAAFFGISPKPTESSSSGTTETINVFDGKTRRSFWKSDTSPTTIGEPRRVRSRGLISDEPPSLTNLARPHMFLLDSGCPKVPLSIYLKGIKAISAYPNPSYFSRDWVISVHILGDAEFKGLQCIKILIDTTLANGIRHNGWELWLAKDRNLIPVRNFSYTYRWSKEMPIAESTVDEWKEIRPGVWFPIKAHTDRYHSRTVKREGKQKLSWRMQYHVKSVLLDPPRITQDVFTKLEFPEGTPITVRNHGKVSTIKNEDKNSK